MSLVRKLILTGAIGLSAIVSGCNDKPPMDQRYTGNAAIPAVLSESLETITTQITDVDTGFVTVKGSTGDSSVGYSFAYKFVTVKGGDASKRLVLIYPTSKAFEKYVPVKINFKRIQRGTISAEEFAKRYISGSLTGVFNYTIEADGIIEPNGVEYIAEKK